MAASLLLYPVFTSLTSFWIIPFFLSLSQFATCLPSLSKNGSDRLELPGMLGATRPSCAEVEQFPQWYQPSMKCDLGDCEKAINLFYNDYVKDHDGTRYEYIASGKEPVHGIPTQRVPLKITVGRSSTKYTRNT